MVDYGDRILNVARDLFLGYGLRNVTMDHISRELGMSKRTLYEKYPTKKEIVITITKYTLDYHEREYKNLLKKSRDAVDEVLILMEHLSNMFARLNARMIFDMQKYFPEAWQLFQNHRKQFMLKKIIDNLRKGIKEELFRRDINVEVLALMRLEQIQQVLDPKIFPSEKFSVSEIHRQLLLHYLYGISTSKGHKAINEYLRVEE